MVANHSKLLIQNECLASKRSSVVTASQLAKHKSSHIIMDFARADKHITYHPLTDSLLVKDWHINTGNRTIIIYT